MRYFDLHIDTLVRALVPGVDLLAGAAEASVDLPRLTEAGGMGAVWAACDDVHLQGAGSAGRVLRMVAAGRDLAARAGGRMRLVTSAADLEDCLQRGGPCALLLAVEGAHSLAGSLEMFAAFQALGVRLLTLTWNHANPFGSGCRTDPHEDRGLTPLGRELLAAAMRLGVVIDLAHASAATLADALGCIAHPPLVSHCACAALRPHPRNLSDAQLREIGAAGGVVGITFCPAFLAEEGASIATVVAHVRHALDTAGPAAVALGSDFDGVPSLPEGIGGCEDMPALFEALFAAGLSEPVLEGIAWRNAARVLGAGLRGVSP
ncbi:MAG: membrane dipeptidase [Candidatus Eisenbacteria bacterium]